MGRMIEQPSAAGNDAAMTNFQFASSTLDAGVKIYAYRVDSVTPPRDRSAAALAARSPACILALPISRLATRLARHRAGRAHTRRRHRLRTPSPGTSRGRRSTTRPTSSSAG